MKIIFFILFLFLINQNVEILAKTNNAIIVKIDNEIITSFDIKNKILSTLIISNREINQKNIDDLKIQALETLIQNKLKEIELTKFNFKTDQTQINSYINSISSNNIDDLKNRFQINNLDFEMFLKEIENEFKWRKLVFNKYSKKIKIDPESIDQEIKKITQNQKDLIEYSLSEIEVLTNNDKSDQNKINQVQKEINEYGFENSIIKFSISSTASNKGKIGWISSSSLSNQISKLVKKMKIGDVSKPIKRQNSILFLKLNDKRISKSSEINLDELKNNLINQKRNELFNLFSRSDLSKSKNTKLIEYF